MGIAKGRKHGQKDARQLDIGPLRRAGKQEDSAEGGNDGKPGLPAGIEVQKHHYEGYKHRVQIHQSGGKARRNELVGSEKENTAAGKQESQNHQETQLPAGGGEFLSIEHHPDSQERGRQSIAEKKHHQHRHSAFQERLGKKRIGAVGNACYNTAEKPYHPSVRNGICPFACHLIKSEREVSKKVPLANGFYYLCTALITNLAMKVLFVCHGNICRSPMAEFILKALVKARGLEDRFHIESAAVSTEEIGNPISPGQALSSAARGVVQSGEKGPAGDQSRLRPFRPHHLYGCIQPSPHPAHHSFRP